MLELDVRHTSGEVMTAPPELGEGEARYSGLSLTRAMTFFANLVSSVD